MTQKPTQFEGKRLVRMGDKPYLGTLYPQSFYLFSQYLGRKPKDGEMIGIHTLDGYVHLPGVQLEWAYLYWLKNADNTGSIHSLSTRR